MKRYIVITKNITADQDDEFTSEHSITYRTRREAAEEQFKHMERSEYTCTGFRIVELEGEDEI